MEVYVDEDEVFEAILRQYDRNYTPSPSEREYLIRLRDKLNEILKENFTDVPVRLPKPSAWLDGISFPDMEKAKFKALHD